MSARSLRLSRRAVVAAGLVLAGCGGGSETKFAPVCPQLSLLQDAADLTRFAGPAGAPQDARSLALAARISAVPARCAALGTDKVRATLDVLAQVRRGPAAPGDTAQLRYFVAVTEGDKVLTERDFALAAKFRPNVDQVAAKGEDIVLTLPVSKQKTAAAYHIYIGFRLTPDELAYNRAQASQ